MDSSQSDPRLVAARRLHGLALDYAARSHATQAALVSAFEDDALALAAEIGELLVEDEDDERLSLTALGRFEGRVLNDDSSDWKTLTSPDDVAENYDPVDLFSDVASALEDEFPGISGADILREDPSEEPGEADPGPADDPPSRGPVRRADLPAGDSVRDELGEGPSSATLQALEHLHAAGVLNDAQFDAKRAELDQQA